MGCIRHPSVNADYTCATCGAPTCATCVFSSADGVTYCPSCASNPAPSGIRGARFAVAAPAGVAAIAAPAGVSEVATPLAVAEVAPPAPAARSASHSNLVEAARALRASQRCVQHPGVVAKNMCDACHAWMCETCQFTAGDSYVCPRCAAAPPATVSEGRRNLAKGAYVAATWSTVAMVLLFVGNFGGRATNGENTAIGYLILVPAVAGLAMAATTLEKRLPTPPFLRVPFYWNGVILALYLLLIFIGTCR